MTPPTTLDTVYDPRSVEPDIYARWERSGAFRSNPADPPTPHDRTFTIVIPPPNVTGALHLGHALNNTLQDILIRYHRMRGFNTLWQPGTDHAGIATQAVVERRIREQDGKTRHELGREELVRRIWQWKDEYESRILNQLKLMGCSCDWERTRFTLDEGLAKAVREMFFRLFKDGLIFRGKRLVNWDTQLQTAVSDDEVYYETVKGHFWHIKYPVIDPKPGEPDHVVIATTRPETMLGDTAVAVHPDPAAFFDRQTSVLTSDLETARARSSKDAGEIEAKLEALAVRRDTHLDRLIKLRNMAGDGRRLRLPLVEREIPLIADEWADPTKGSGCVKITPAHDPNDYEVALRYELPMINVMTPDGMVARITEPDGTVNARSGDYEGLAFSAAGRDKVVADLEARGLLVEVEDHDVEVGHSDRSKLPIEPFLSDQWFVRTGGLRNGSAAGSEPGAEPQASACAAPRTPTNGAEPQASACTAPRTPDLSFGATLLTWTTYGTWLPGDRRGFVSRARRQDGSNSLQNIPGEPYDANEPAHTSEAQRRMSGPAVFLSQEHASSVLRSIAETCERHGIELLAIAIMPNHVHVLCQSEQHGRELLQLLKGNASRHLNKDFVSTRAARWWTKSGSRRRIRAGVDLTAAIEYVQQQRSPLLAWSFDRVDTHENDIVEAVRADVHASRGGGSAARAKARGSGSDRRTVVLAASGLAPAAMGAVNDGRIEVVPSRYAKSYLDWLGEKRDWCISRQLWWGHRIPVWAHPNPGGMLHHPDLHNIIDRLNDYEERGKAFHSLWATGRVRLDTEIAELPSQFQGYWTSSPDAEPEFRKLVESVGFIQDPDVLDTWFSSALWPFSTLGWPDDTPHLAQYYPGSVLVTNRDIITNWVARMVMFGLYARGDVPFDRVYIHPKILDGRGETMSKSKGNGVDPVDIIHTHGADALRFAMADMCTETQDIRVPVEYICPHCGKLTSQDAAIKAETQRRKSRGETLQRKLQPADCVRVTCSNKTCGKAFATQWADESTKADLGLGRETSDKFDIGRNFCNKLWNAARFALMNLDGTPCEPLDIDALPPEDRWILARLSQTIRRYHECMTAYQFSASIRELREFFWDGLCDWYIELTKPRLTGGAGSASSPAGSGTASILGAEPEPRASARAASAKRRVSSPNAWSTAKQVLALCLDQVLRLWHPTLPFITETLWQHLNEVVPRRGLPGVVDLTCDTDLIAAPFPPVEGYPSLDDDAIVATFRRLQTATRGVRDIRANCGVSPKESVTATVVVPPCEVDALKAQAHIFEHMAKIGTLAVSSQSRRPKNAGSLIVGDMRIYVHDISDDDAERARITKQLASVQKQVRGKESKLANERFVANAAPDIVEAERQRLAHLLVERTNLQQHLADLGE